MRWTKQERRGHAVGEIHRSVEGTWGLRCLGHPSEDARSTGRYTSLKLLCNKNARHTVGALSILVESEAQSRCFAGLVCVLSDASSVLSPLLFLVGPKSKLHLLEKDLNYQLELLGEASLFHSLIFFKKVPSARSPQGTSAGLKPCYTVEKLRLTQVETYCLWCREPCGNLKAASCGFQRGCWDWEEA